MVVYVSGGEEVKGQYLERRHDPNDPILREIDFWIPIEKPLINKSTKARDTLMSSGMTKSEDGSIYCCVTYTDFNSLTQAPEYISASLAKQFLDKDYYTFWNSTNYGGNFQYRSDVINPQVSHTGRKTETFVTVDGESATLAEGWSYFSSGRDSVQVSTPPNATDEYSINHRLTLLVSE